LSINWVRMNDRSHDRGPLRGYVKLRFNVLTA
jgi:hypothetical protein